MDVNARIWNEDCIAGMPARLDADSVDLVVTSIPFEELFQYSNKVEDVGNNGSTNDIRAGRFALNMRFVVHQMYRVMKPGTVACIHIQQLLAFKCQHGFMGRRDFRGAMVDVFGAGGFLYVGEFAIAKDPQLMAARLNLHSLQFKTGYARTATNLAPAPNDYVLIFQKPGETPNPVRPIEHPKNPAGWVTQDEWIRDAHGIWTDIRMTDVLDVAHTREEKHEKHVCPLQLEVIRRLVRLYTNPIEVQPDVTVLDPFMGIGSTAWVCLCGPSNDRKVRPLESPRNVVGFELKESYHRAAFANVARALKGLEGRGEAGGPDGGMLPFGDGPPAEREDDVSPDLAEDVEPDPDLPPPESPVPADATDEDLSARGLARVFGCNRCNTYRTPDFHPCPACRCPEYRIVAVPSRVGRAEKPAEATVKKRGRKAGAESAPFDREAS